MIWHSSVNLYHSRHGNFKAILRTCHPNSPHQDAHPAQHDIDDNNRGKLCRGPGGLSHHSILWKCPATGQRNAFYNLCVYDKDELSFKSSTSGGAKKDSTPRKGQEEGCVSWHFYLIESKFWVNGPGVQCNLICGGNWVKEAEPKTLGPTAKYYHTIEVDRSEPRSRLESDAHGWIESKRSPVLCWLWRLYGLQTSYHLSCLIEKVDSHFGFYHAYLPWWY